MRWSCCGLGGWSDQIEIRYVCGKVVIKENGVSIFAMRDKASGRVDEDTEFTNDRLNVSGAVALRGG